MFLKGAAVEEFFPARGAAIRLFPRVDQSVQLEAVGLREPPATDVAAVQLLP